MGVGGYEVQEDAGPDVVPLGPNYYPKETASVREEVNCMKQPAEGGSVFIEQSSRFNVKIIPLEDKGIRCKISLMERKSCFVFIENKTTVNVKLTDSHTSTQTAKISNKKLQFVRLLSSCHKLNKSLMSYNIIMMLPRNFSSREGYNRTSSSKNILSPLKVVSFQN